MKKIISFDIFDTLINRSVPNPQDVFDIVESKYNSTFENKIEDFKGKRIKAEKNARQHTTSEEILLDDIYKELVCKEGIDKNQLEKLEIETEKQVCYANPKFKNIYQKYIDNGYKVIVVSDMYLTKDVIEEILLSNGYTRYSHLYLSSETFKTKRTGSLFKEILKLEGIKASELVHYGDNLKSDVLQPMKLGIKFKHVKRAQYSGSKGFQMLSAFINRYCPYHKNDYYENFGYTAFGPLLYGYCLWLAKQFQTKGLNKVYFLSRDGYIIKKAFDKILPLSDIHEFYLEVSRRSLRVPTLWMNYSLNTLLSMIGDPISISLKSIFDGVGLDMDSYNDEINDYGFTEDTIFFRKKIEENTKLTDLYNHLLPDILSHSKKEYKELCDYLEEVNISGKFAIVDIGWTGGMQRSLKNALDSMGIPNEIYGFYTGVTEMYKKNFDGTNQNLFGFLFDFLHNKDSIDDRSPFVGLYETLFLEGRGSVKCYQKTNGHSQAVRYPYEYAHNGKLDEVYYIVQQIQHAALRFVEDATKYGLLSYSDLKPADYFCNLRQVGTNPTKDEIKYLGNLTFYDEGKTNHLVSCGSWGGVCAPSKPTKERFGFQPLENRIPQETFKDQLTVSSDIQKIKENQQKMNSVAAGIVVYNPNYERLCLCITRLKSQVSCIIVYDNSNSPSKKVDYGKDVIYLSNGRNDGVSHALNEIFEKGRQLGFKWILTMDQDTVVPENMVETFSSYFNYEKVGIICPQVVDKRRVYLKPEKANGEISYIPFCITSASCTNLEIWEKLGGFDDFLFIDFVDNDYCKRLILNGYKILRCNNIVIDQEFGKIELKSHFWVNFYTKLSEILGNKNVAKLSYKKSVSPLRVYYVHRNLLYLNKKFKESGGIGYDNFYCHNFGAFLLYFSLPSLVRGKKKWKILKAELKGLYDGFQAARQIK